MTSLPPYILTVLAPFAILFLKPKTASKAFLLLAGAILCRGGRTVCGALRILGMEGEARFDKYHRVLNRDKWCPLQGGRILLQQIIGESCTEIVIAVDEHIERRGGKKIKAKGCYRDAVRSSRSCLVRCFGLKWITVMVLKELSWSKRLLALPFLTLLAPSEKANSKAHKRHKTTIDWTKQLVKLLRRWLPSLRIILTGDGGFANAELAWVCLKHHVCLVSRLRLDARLFALPPEQKGRGRMPKKGNRLLSPAQMFKQTDLNWCVAVVRWYGGKFKQVEYVTVTCLWHVCGYDPVPIRLVLLRDPQGEYESVALMGIDRLFELSSIQIIEHFVARWSQEVTHREVREHLGVETQRQWSDRAIARTTPILFALYSLIILMADRQDCSLLKMSKASWYRKNHLTFGDLLCEARRHLWSQRYFNLLSENNEPTENRYREALYDLVEQLAKVA
jgi:hypothetical protein